jgi:hypothetical protein
MKHAVIQRPEMLEATLNLGGAPISLAEYATTGLLAVAVGPRGNGKTNAGLLMAEQLADQGWVSVLIDPESELELLYGEAVKDPEELRELLASRERAIVVVSAKDATEFVPYGRAILDAAEDHRKPVFVVIDEGQLFSATKKRQGDIGEAADIINEFAGRGRKRALDLFITALRFSGTINRSIFSNKNLTLIGCQEDPTAWSALAPQFRASRIEFSDLNALAPGEFVCISRRGTEKVKMPMAQALAQVAPKAKAVRRTLPTNYSQWDRAMRAIPTPRLHALTDPVVALLGTVAGLTTQQMLAGATALQDELECRA